MEKPARQPVWKLLKLRFWLPHEDFHNPTRKRVDVKIDISSLTRQNMNKRRNFKAGN